MVRPEVRIVPPGRVIALMYHDIVEPGAEDCSGFPGRDAALYKIDRALFNTHLAALRLSGGDSIGTIVDLEPDKKERRQTGGAAPVLITFDDGGVSAVEAAASLEAFGWRGHFFVTAGRIGSPGFLNRDQISDLHNRGHVIGSHSFSHPVRMSYCSPDQLLHEWTHSIELLSQVVGEPIRAASVPGGFYAVKVAEAAAATGIKFLFTSEPTTRSKLVRGCAVLGRYTLQRRTSAETVAAIAAGHIAPRVQQAALWKAKKLAKALGGEYYLKVRKALLGRP